MMLLGYKWDVHGGACCLTHLTNLQLSRADNIPKPDVYNSPSLAFRISMKFPVSSLTLINHNRNSVFLMT